MDTLYTIKDMMYCELDDIAKKEKLDSKDVELIDKFVDIIKDIDEIGMTGIQEMNGYSGNGGYGGSYAYRNYSRNGGGYSGRMMPMYNRGSYDNGNGGYSRDESKEAMLSHLQNVASMAVDERDRKAVERLMQQMREN